MEIAKTTPKMKASYLTRMAEQFANRIIEDLNEINAQYPIPKVLSEQESEGLKSFQPPDPEKSREEFQRIFCELMAQRYMIIPG